MDGRKIHYITESTLRRWEADRHSTLEELKAIREAVKERGEPNNFHRAKLRHLSHAHSVQFARITGIGLQGSVFKLTLDPRDKTQLVSIYLANIAKEVAERYYQLNFSKTHQLIGIEEIKLGEIYS